MYSLGLRKENLVEGMAGAAKDLLVLAGVHLLELLAASTEVLAWVEPVWVLGEDAADGAGHDDTAIGVDVDLADSRLGSLTELLLWDADSSWHVAAVLVDHGDVLLWDGGGAVENDWEAWKLLFDLVKDVKADLSLVAWWELVCTMGGTDGDSKGVNTSALDEVFDFLWASVDVLCSLNIVLNTSKNAKFTLDSDVVFLGVSELANLLGEGNVILIREVGAVDHDRAEAVFDAGLAELEGVTMVKVENDWDELVLRMDLLGILSSSLSHVAEHGLVGVLAGTSRDLKDYWRFSLNSSRDDSLELLHVGEVVARDSIATVDGLSEHIFRVDETKRLVRDSHKKVKSKACDLLNDRVELLIL